MATLTAEELLNAVREFVEQGALHYRKIIDVAAANSDADMERLKQLLVLARNSPQGGATRAGGVRRRWQAWRYGTRARGLHRGRRAAHRVFTNLHEARKWLDEIFKVELKR